MCTKQLDGKLFGKLISGGAANLRLNVKTVNDLNVFPIPDGDTGDNMSMTIGGGVRSMENCGSDSISEASKALSKGMLMSARGNSGVILSQFFAGIAEGLANLETAEMKDVAKALKKGVESAYASVMTPTEGTILTVARESVEYACSNISEDTTLESFNCDFLKEMNASLQRTPELLACLKEAGVIDSGGAGLFYIFDGINRTLNGDAPQAAEFSPSKNEIDLSKFNEDSVMEFGYCTEFLLQLTNAKTDIASFDAAVITERLSELGDSIVAVRDGTVVKIHVHTMTPEKVLEFCHGFGEFLTLKIENMTLQHHETVIENRFDDRPRKKYGMVTVATGDGVIETLKQLGADEVIDGGQGKNPSTEDFIDAFDRTGAEIIFVLPNNGNICMAAKQASSMYEKADVRVIESKSIGDGYAALTMLNYDSDNADEIENSLREAMEGVTTGLVTKAVRTTCVDGINIKDGDHIGFTEKKMLVTSPSSEETAELLAEALGAKDHEYMIVIFGKGASESDRNAFRTYMKNTHRRLELCEINGGQDVYDYIMILQ